MKIANFLVGFIVTFLIFMGSVFYAEAASDIFGITKIYPTKTGGNTWFMDMADPASDPRFNPQSTITQNPDGSWKM